MKISENVARDLFAEDWYDEEWRALDQGEFDFLRDWNAPIGAPDLMARLEARLLEARLLEARERFWDAVYGEHWLAWLEERGFEIA